MSPEPSAALPLASPFAPFALFERDDGGAWLLTGLRAALDVDLAAEADPAGALAGLLGTLEAASRQGEWIASALTSKMPVRSTFMRTPIAAQIGPAPSRTYQ